MNAFANTLFTMLFGWIRAGVQSVWNSVTQGRFLGFFTWLGDHWFPVLLFLCAVCTVLDYLIWLVRWRPYLVWKTKLRRFFSRLRGKQWSEKTHFDRGYAGGVSIPLEPVPAYRQPLFEERRYAAVPEPEPPAMPEPDFYEAPPAAEPPQYAPIFNAPPAPVFQPVEPAPAPVFFQEPAQPEQPSPAPEQPAARRRRSQKHERQRSPLWLLSDPGDEGMLDGLPPAVNKEDAFHAPVYPNYPDSAYAARRPMAGNDSQNEP